MYIAQSGLSAKCFYYYNTVYKNLESIWKKYRKVFENLLTKCEYGAILCTEKDENKTKI